MSEDPVDVAVGRMEDDSVRGRVAGGDFSDLADLGLDDEQRSALAQLAEQFGDVTGLAMTSFMGMVGGLGTVAPKPFDLSGSNATQVREVTVRGYDPVSQKNIIGKS